MGGSLSASKVVKGMVFDRESEGAFFSPPPASTYKSNLDQTLTAYRNDQIRDRSKSRSI